MAIDKDKIRKKQRKKIYERKNLKRSSDIDLSSSSENQAVNTVISTHSSERRSINKTLKVFEIQSKDDSSNTDDTAKQNVELYKNTVETVVSKISDIALNKQENISHKSNILSDNSTHNRKDTRINKNKRKYEKNRRKIHTQKQKKVKEKAKETQVIVEKITRRINKETLKFMGAATASFFGIFLLIMPIVLLLTVGAGGEAYNQSQAKAAVTYPAEDSDITKATAYWQTLQVQIKTQLEKVPELSAVKDKYTRKKSAVCDFMTDNTALLSFISAYFVPSDTQWNFEDAKNLIDDIFEKMYVIEYSISGDTLDYKISEKKSWEDILNEYLNDDQKKKYQGYYEHKGGAVKAFSSPFAFDWSGYITSPFGYRDWGGGDIEFHKGVDFGVPHGTEICSVADGTVVKTYTACTHDYPKDYGCGCGGNYGNYVDILTEDGQYYITYGHMSEVYVNVGDKIQNGQVVGLSGCTGWSTGNHLHLEMRLGYEQGELIDPLTYIQDYVPLVQKGEKQ